MDNASVTSNLIISTDRNSDDFSTNRYNTVSDGPVCLEYQCKAYKRRWWILLVFCFASLCQSLLWNTWSPLLDSLLISYQWTNSFVALIQAVSDAGFIVFAFPLMYVVETTDLRHGMVIAASLLVFNMALWNIAFPTNQHWLVVIGSVLNGVTGCITLAAPSLLSVIWFPMSERTTATAFASSSSSIGSAVAFLTSPYITGANVTASEVKHRDQLSPDFLDKLKIGISNMVYFETGVVVVCFVMVVVYFPPRPPRPPSISQTKHRANFFQGLKSIYKNLNFWLMNIAFNLPNGSFNSWLPLCSMSFRSLGVGEVTAGWIGFFSLVAGVVSSIVVSAIADRMKRRLKLFCVILSLLALAALLLLACIQGDYIYIPENYFIGVLYTLCIGASMFINGCVPLFYELGCEVTFPVHEGLTNTVLNVVNNLVGMLFFLLFLVPSLASDTRWMTWTCVGTCALSIPLLVIMKDRYPRLELELDIANN